MSFRRAFPFGTALLFALVPGACFAAAAAGPTSVRTDAHGDPLPPGALLRLGTVRWRAGTRSLAFTPDGKTLVIGDYSTSDGVIRCWDTATGKETASFHLPACPLPFALSPDGKTLAVDATSLHALLFVSVPDGKEIRRIEVASTAPGANLYFNRLDFAPDGKTLAAVGNDSVCRLFDVGTGKTILHLTGEASGRFPTAFSPDSKRIALIGEENTLRIVDIASAKEIFKRQGKQSEHRPLNMSFSPDGKKLAWMGENAKTFALWDIASGEPVLQFRSPAETVESVQFSPDGKRIGAAYIGDGPAATWFAEGGSIRLWDAETGKELRKLVAPSDAVESFVFSPDGKRLAAGTDYDGVVHLWDVETGTELSRTGEHQGLVCSVAFAPDGRTALTGCADRVVRLWDADKGTVVRRIEVGGDGNPGLFGVDFSRDRKAAAVMWPRGGGGVWDLAAGSRRARLDEDAIAFEMHFAPDGKTVAARGMFDNIRFWDATTGKKIKTIDIDSNNLGAFAFSPDGKWLMATHTDRETVRSNISIWDVALGKEVRSWPATKRIYPTAFSPDGRMIVAAEGREVDLWEVATGRELSPLRVPKETPTPEGLESPAFSPDGRTLAAGDYSGSIYLWEVDTARLRAVFKGHRALVSSLDFSPDGSRLISGSHDTTALIWDLTGIADEKDAKTLTPERLTALWDDLADADAGKAWRAGWRLAADPAASVPFLQRRLRPVEVDAARIAKLLAALDGDDFAEREAASRELAKLGELAGPAERKDLAANPSPEARRRLEQLARGLDKPVEAAEEARALRCVEVLEHVGSADARKLLGELGQGAEGARVTREAKAALERLSKQEERKP